jgi:hypothetical protein
VFLSFGEAHHDLALFQLASGAAPDAAQPGLHHMAWRSEALRNCRLLTENSRRSACRLSPRSNTT